MPAAYFNVQKTQEGNDMRTYCSTVNVVLIEGEDPILTNDTDNLPTHIKSLATFFDEEIEQACIPLIEEQFKKSTLYNHLSNDSKGFSIEIVTEEEDVSACEGDYPNLRELLVENIALLQRILDEGEEHHMQDGTQHLCDGVNWTSVKAALMELDIATSLAENRGL